MEASAAVGVGVFAHFVWLRDQGYEFGVVRGRCLRVPVSSLLVMEMEISENRGP